VANVKIALGALLFLFQLSVAHAQQWELDFEKAKQTAHDGNKAIVLVFSGSDWCGPCMKLEKEIWETDEFRDYSAGHYIMVRADFPRRKENKLPQEQEAKNAKLAEKYNTDGYFPLVVVMDKNGKVLGKTGYKKLSPTEYIEHLNSFIR
jgi:thioredoxin-related protein